MTDLQAQVNKRIRGHGVTLLNRSDWGSKEQATYRSRLSSRRVSVEKVDTVVQHITVTFDNGKLVGDFKKDMQTVERIGKERFGSGFSYNFGVDMITGMVGVGQPLLAKGTHTINDKGVKGYSYDQNHAARAIAVVGMPGDRLSDRAMKALGVILASMMEAGACTWDPDYLPHSFFASKDCPCDPTRDRMDEAMAYARKIRRS